MNPAGFLLVVLIRLYRKLVSPVLTALFGPMGMGCRFSPTCSLYALEALQVHGTSRGFGLAVRRFCRCHPWGPAGFDPVPPREEKTALIETRGATAKPLPTASSPTLSGGSPFPD